MYYDIANYFGTDVITIQNLQVKSTTLSAGILIRTGGNAIQAGNRIADNFSLATLTSVALPTAPVAGSVTKANLCTGFAITEVVGSVTVAQVAGGTIQFYDVLTNLLLFSRTTAGNILASDLGYNAANNTILGSRQFYMAFISSST